MKILVTGGAGYIGSHTILEIIAHTSWEVVSLDNYINSGPETYKRLHQISGKSIEHHNIDLQDKTSLRALFQKHQFDGVMHFAALKAVGESVDEPLKYYQNNIKGLLNLIEVQSEFGVKNHLYSSSCTVYGVAEKLPVTELSPAGKAESPYGYTKVMGEQILNDASKKGLIKTLALRYFNPVGAHVSGLNGELPNGTPNNLVPYITQTASGIRECLTIHGNDYDTRDGTCVRDYIHVSDIAKAHVNGMMLLFEEKQKVPFDFINLGTGNGVTVSEVVEAFERANSVQLNYKFGPRREGDVVEIFADNSKAQSILNWEPKANLDTMMKSAWAWQLHLDSQSL